MIQEPRRAQAVARSATVFRDLVERTRRAVDDVAARVGRYFAALFEHASHPLASALDWTRDYQALRPVRILGTSVQWVQEFWLEPCENEDDIHLGMPRFKRAPGYADEHNDGHASDPAVYKAGAAGDDDGR